MQPNDVLSDKQSFINLQTHCVKYFVLCESQVYPDLLLRTSEILGHKVIEEECTALISWLKLLSKQCAYQSFQTGTTDSTFKMVLKEMVVILGAMHIWERKLTGLQYLYPKLFLSIILIAVGLFAPEKSVYYSHRNPSELFKKSPYKVLQQSWDL